MSVGKAAPRKPKELFPRAPKELLPTGHQRSFLPDTSPTNTGGGCGPASCRLFAWRVSDAESGPGDVAGSHVRVRIGSPRVRHGAVPLLVFVPRVSAKNGRHIERSSEMAYGARALQRPPGARPTSCPPFVHHSHPRSPHPPPGSPPTPSALSTKSPTFATCSGL